MKEAFEPKNKIKASIMVTEIWDNMKGVPKPIEYFLNGFARHHEKLSGLAGDIKNNKGK